ncbi:hypothetical protein M9H77_17232 [Catharanthus roseus]|uniref:Uncharacterized protein n=1 Tax=Catharanthus roseus TaxID=4058 RepID=A0ACC0B413_CATRO|nr:hypothetical protein M9H77_17232 [Catharanthus roseus]
MAPHAHFIHSMYILYGLLQRLGWSAFISSPLFTTGSLEISRFLWSLSRTFIWSYPVSIAETHPPVAHEPNEVHGWFLSVRASEALSHQSFVIPRSLTAANVTLRTSSYLRVS